MNKVYQQWGLKVKALYARLKGLPQHGEWTNYHTKRFLASLSEKELETISNYGVGIEIEVENAEEVDISGWEVVKDGSLRDNGYEYKTTYGHRVGYLRRSLTELEQVFSDLSFKFSERCSVHTHIDVRNMSIDQVNGMFCLYMLFEQSLFRFAGEKRAHNIFCVPWGESSECVRRYSFVDVVDHASKYTAMNLLCLREFGTVEFRHMEGNCDAERIFQWVLLLSCLRKYAETYSLSEIQNQLDVLKTESQYQHFMTQVFGELRHALTFDPKKIDEAISDSRLFFF